MNASGVVFRIAPAGGSYTYDGGGFSNIPLTNGSNWQQPANESQELFAVGTVVVSNPSGSNCTQGGGTGIQVDLHVDSLPTMSEQFPAPAPGGSDLSFDMELDEPSSFQLKFPAPVTISEGHTVQVQAADNCPGSDHLTIDFNFDVIGHTPPG